MTSKRGFRLGLYAAVLGCVHLGLPAAATAQQDEPLWVRQLGTEGNDSALGVATDPAGNVYLAGSTKGSLGGVNRGGYDAWVAKYDAAGQVLWKRQFGTENTDQALGVATDAAGNVYVTGYTVGSLGGANSGNYDAWVAKYDNGGHLLWKRQFAKESWTIAKGVATDAAGNVYLTGDTSGLLGGVHRGSDDAWVAKYDNGGHLLWKREIGTRHQDSGSGVAIDAAGNVYLTGWTDGHLGGARAHVGTEDAWVTKYDTTGHLLWKRQLGTKPTDIALGVATDAAGNVYLTGFTYGLLGGAINRCLPYFSAWVAKYDTAGDLLWTRQFVDYASIASGLATDAAGNVYLTGVTYGSLGGANFGHEDAWVAKYDTAGDLLWTRQLGTEGGDAAFGVATDAAGNAYLTGFTYGSLGGANRGEGDAWVAKYSAQP